MPWSIGCNTDVVFGGKNWSFTLLYSTVGWDDALSKNNIFLFSNAILRFNFFNQVSNTPDVIQAFLFELDPTNNWSFLIPLKHRGFAYLHSTNGLTFSPNTKKSPVSSILNTSFGSWPSNKLGNFCFQSSTIALPTLPLSPHLLMKAMSCLRWKLSGQPFEALKSLFRRSVANFKARSWSDDPQTGSLRAATCPGQLIDFLISSFSFTLSKIIILKLF